MIRPSSLPVAARSAVPAELACRRNSCAGGLQNPVFSTSYVDEKLVEREIIARFRQIESRGVGTGWW